MDFSASLMVFVVFIILFYYFVRKKIDNPWDRIAASVIFVSIGLFWMTLDNVGGIVGHYLEGDEKMKACYLMISLGVFFLIPNKK